MPLNDAGELGYFGLAGTNTTDDQDVIGFIQPQREPFLEYDLTRLIHNLANPKKRVVGLVSGIPIDADPANQYKPWRVVEQIKQFFEVKSLGLDPDITDDIDVLMIVHPFGLSDKTLYAIDQFILAGGKTMVFVDPYAEEGSRSNAAMRLPPDQGSNLEKLFKAWGVDYAQDKVLADLGLAQRVQAEVDPQGRPVITNYVSWLSFPADRLKSDDVITGQLRAINVATAGFVAKAKDADVTFDPLIVSTEASAPMEAQKFRFQPNPAEILKSFEPKGKSLTLAARLSGKLESAFPDGPPKEKDKDAKDEADKKDGAAKKPHLKESKDVVNLIVVADSDILADSFWLQVQDFFGQRLVVPTANNADFVINALDNLSGSSELIGLRSRGFSDRPFDRVIEIQRAAELQYRDRERALLGGAQGGRRQAQGPDNQGTGKRGGHPDGQAEAGDRGLPAPDHQGPGRAQGRAPGAARRHRYARCLGEDPQHRGHAGLDRGGRDRPLDRPQPKNPPALRRVGRLTAGRRVENLR